MANYLAGYHGTIKDHADEFVHTMALVAGAGDQGTLAEDVADAFTAFYNDGSNATWRTQQSNAITYTHVTVAEILDLTAGTLAAANRVSLPAGLIGGLTTVPPSQVACAVSTRGGTYANGTPVRGRYYLPLIVPSVTSGLFLAPGALTIAQAALQLHQDLIAGAGASPAVWSRKLGSLSTIEEYRVGTVPDTIRSRRNNTAETYQTVVVT